MLLAEDEFRSLDESDLWESSGSLYRWGSKGKDPFFIEKAGRMAKCSLILAINSRGRFLAWLVDGSMTCMVYSAYLRELAKRFEQTGLMILQDNAAIHHAMPTQATADIYGVGNFQSLPYFLEGNGVEYAFTASRNANQLGN